MSELSWGAVFLYVVFPIGLIAVVCFGHVWRGGRP